MRILLFITLTIYQKIMSPLLHQLLGVKEGYGCRHTPTCSAYAKEIITKQGLLKGTMLSVHRLVNCQPFFSI